MHPGDKELHVHHAPMNAYITHINWKWDWKLAPFPPVSNWPLGLKITFTNLSLSLSGPIHAELFHAEWSSLRRECKHLLPTHQTSPQEMGAFWLEDLEHTQRVHLWDLCQGFSPSRGRFCSQVKGGSISSMEERIPLYFGSYFLFVCLGFGSFFNIKKTKLINSRSICNCEFPTKRRQVLTVQHKTPKSSRLVQFKEQSCCIVTFFCPASIFLWAGLAVLVFLLLQFQLGCLWTVLSSLALEGTVTSSTVAHYPPSHRWHRVIY